MNCYTYFIRTLRYFLAFVLICSLVFVVDRELCEGTLEHFVSQFNPRLAIEYVDTNVRLEAAIDYVKTDSTKVLMHLLWTI